MEKLDRKVEELEMLSHGYWGKVYILSDDLLLKISSSTEEMMKDEFNRFRTVFEAGVPCVEPVKMVETDQGIGYIVQRIQGGSIARRASQHLEDMETYIDAYTGLAKKMWAVRIPEGSLPNAKDDLLAAGDRISDFMDPEVMREYREFVKAMPDEDRFLHTDYHWSNVMYNNGDCKLIDMNYALRGHPAFDMMAVSHMYWLLRDYPLKMSYQDIFRITADEASHVWDGFCERVFAGLPAQVAADRKKMLESMGRIYFTRNMSNEYAMGTLSEKTVSDMKTFVEDVLREDKDFILRVMNEWKLED